MPRPDDLDGRVAFELARRVSGRRAPVLARSAPDTEAEPGTGRSVAMDTGFMVFNHVTYPNLTRLFRELGVPVKATEMSFSVQHRPSGLEFSGSSVNHLFAQRRNLLRPRFWRLLWQVNRFNAEGNRGGVPPRVAGHDLEVEPLAPSLELLDGGGAEGVARREQNRFFL